jgi:hypothetical protein
MAREYFEQALPSDEWASNFSWQILSLRTSQTADGRFAPEAAVHLGFLFLWPDNKRQKDHAGITPHGLCETVPLGPPEIPSRGTWCAVGRACLGCNGITHISGERTCFNQTCPLSHCVFSNLQG